MTDGGRRGRTKTGASLRTALKAGTSLPDRGQNYLFDRFLSVSTRQPVLPIGSVSVQEGENCPYSGASWLPVRRMLRSLSPGPSDIFVDLGSGKGKVVLIAGRLPYKRAIGVEIDKDLCGRAEENLRRARPRLRAQSAEIANASVLNWPIPDDTSTVFMFNPFIGQTFRSAVERIFESYERQPRDLHIVYQFPWEHDWLLSTNRVSVRSVRPSSWPARPGWWRRGDVIICYRVGEMPGNDDPSPWPGRRRATEHWSRPNGHRFAMGELTAARCEPDGSP